MGLFAARQFDACVHGGNITIVSNMTVRIGGQFAATVGDFHTCPMSDGPKPHVGGNILKGSLTVKIMGKPAARVGDPAECKGPPDMILAGCPTVTIGG
jgi:uncharacterized Zn-binding protein involved in type VI secretion